MRLKAKTGESKKPRTHRWRGEGKKTTNAQKTPLSDRSKTLRQQTVVVEQVRFTRFIAGSRSLNEDLGNLGTSLQVSKSRKPASTSFARNWPCRSMMNMRTYLGVCTVLDSTSLRRKPCQSPTRHDRSPLH